MIRLLKRLAELTSRLTDVEPGTGGFPPDPELSLRFTESEEENREYVLVGQETGKSNLNSSRRFGPFSSVKETVRAAADLEESDDELWLEERDPDRDCVVARLPYVQWATHRLRRETS